MTLKSPTLWFLFLFNFTLALSMAYFTNHGELYFQGEHLSDSAIGLYFSIASIGYFIGPFLAPILHKKLNFHLTLVIITVGIALSLGCLNFTLSTSFAPYNMLVYTVGNSLFQIAANVFVTDMADKNSRGKIIGFYNMFTFIPWIIAPYIDPSKGATLPGVTIFAILALAIGLYVLLAKFGAQEEAQVKAAQHKFPPPPPMNAKTLASLPFSLLAAAPLAGVSALVAGLWSQGINDTLMLFGTENHVSTLDRDLWGSAFGWGGLALPILGYITDKIGVLRSYLYGAIFFILWCIGAFFFTFTGLVGLVFLVVFGLYYAWVYILYLVYLGQSFTGNALSQKVAGAQVFYALGSIGGPSLFGNMLTTYGDTGYVSGILGATVCVFATTVGVLMYQGKSVKKPRGP